MIRRRRLPLLIGSACAAALLSAGLVAAQTVSPPPVAQPATPPAPAVQPPGPELPPQEIAPPVAPPPEAKPSAKHAQPDDSDDQDDKPVKKDGKDAKADDGVEAKDDGGKPAEAQRQVHGAAVIQALDKITAETMRFEIKAGQSLRWKGLVFTLRSCETSAPDEPVKDAIAYLLVRSDPRAQSAAASREIFHGWMFASSPGLNPLKHPVYDAWLISCRA
jgi:hypothetical protein